MAGTTQAATDGPEQTTRLTVPLFPLETVLFPGGSLPLKIFEARYLDMSTQCLRHQTPFGVVCLTQGHEVGKLASTTRFESMGTLARIDQADVQQAGIMQLRCTGTRRFKLTSVPKQEASGLWTATVELLSEDPPRTTPQELRAPSVALAEAAAQFRAQGLQILPAELQLEDAGWVANRWSELLPLSLQTRQGLLELQDPLERLRRVDSLLRFAATRADGESGPEGPGPATHLH